MFVYIPRYEYKIEGQYGEGGTSILPGEIEVNFISKETTIASEGYHLHPAFNFGGTELNGIWVGKFKITGTQEEPTILPSLQILTNKSRAEYFEMSKKYNNKIKNIDSHVIKNVEWASMFYLSQSKYGKYGNNMYTGENKEIYHKVSDSGSISGKSVGDRISAYKSDVCLYDNLTDRGNGTGSCGGGASTTGNITGIYDVSGAPYEFVMGVSNNIIDNSGFSELPDSKYYDNYVVSNKKATCDGGICYGHALDEIKKWYTEFDNFSFDNDCWFLQGNFLRVDVGYADLLALEKMVSSYSETSQYASSRVVLTSLN